MKDTRQRSPLSTQNFALEILAVTIILVCSVTMVWQLFSETRNMGVIFSTGSVITLSVFILVTLLYDPDSIRARQTDSMLWLAGQTLNALKDGLNADSAGKICALLLPVSNARGVVITDTNEVLGKAGFRQEGSNAIFEEGLPLLAAAGTLADGRERVLQSPQDIDLSKTSAAAGAIVVVPLVVGTHTRGTLQFFFHRPSMITNTQHSIAGGFGELLSTQLAASELEEQTKLATSMQLKALQNQINPHFLFNTLNTISSLIRTDPMRARNLLREFATFYRSILKDPDDHGLILLSREIEQTVRYFTFEEARFGADRVALVLDEGEDVDDIPVPAFIIQPLVENAVRHARPAEGKLTVCIQADLEDVQVSCAGADACGDADAKTALVIRVIDDGIGMTPEARDNIMHPESSTGAGIAVKNVADRITGYFGPESSMKVESELGKGTTVTLTLVLGDELPQDV